MSAGNKKPSTQVVDNPNKGLNPIVAICVAIIIALLLAGTSLYVFLRSDAREIIDIKEESISASDTDLSDTPIETGALTTADLNNIEAGIKSTVSTVDGDDFSSSEITDAALGL